jgi:hypothetical protein
MTTDRLNKALEVWYDTHKGWNYERADVRDAINVELLAAIEAEPTAEPTPCGHWWKANLTTTDGVPNAPVSWHCEWCNEGWIGESPPAAEPEPRPDGFKFKRDDRVRAFAGDKNGVHGTVKCHSTFTHVRWDDDATTTPEFDNRLEPIPTPDIDALARARDEASQAYVVARQAHEAAIAAEKGE